MVRVSRAVPGDRDAAVAIVDEYCRALDIVVRDEPSDVDAYFAERSGVWLARDGPMVAGCIALRPLASEGAAEIKRLYVRPAFRGSGVADLLLDALERDAAAFGYRRLYLDTKDDLTAAIRFYARRGYERIPRYNDNPQATIFMRRGLP